MRYRLTSTDASHVFELFGSAPLVVGRAPTSDFAIIDPTISRRHAELQVDDAGDVEVRDLGSSNGTFVNGTRVESAKLATGDLVTFGKVAFRLQQVTTPSPSLSRSTPTILRQLSLREPNAAIAAVDKSQQKLAKLLEVSKGLGKAADIDGLLEKIVEYAYQILDVDRVAILLADESGELTPKIARDKRGADSTRAVPQSIARTAVSNKVAILSDNAGEDTRFGGPSIVMQQVRSTICCPLVGSEEKVLGVLYVDNVTTAHRFSDDDLEFCVGFAGIAAVAIENGQFAQRIQRELIARNNFERFFAPQLAKRIAESADSVKLGGEKRNVAVLFSDIRGFTPLSETMSPEEIAHLLTEYFTQMVECVFRHDGTLDKFMGDAVMAQWGAPIGGADDADKAMRAAIEMMHALDDLNVRWQTEGRPPLQIGIGLNYGEAFAGNIGSERRLEFTVIGDTVNTAHRLCSAAGRGEILLTDEMRRALLTPPALAECPPMELRGKSQPCPVFRVVLYLWLATTSLWTSCFSAWRAPRSWRARPSPPSSKICCATVRSTRMAPVIRARADSLVAGSPMPYRCRQASPSSSATAGTAERWRRCDEICSFRPPARRTSFARRSGFAPPASRRRRFSPMWSIALAHCCAAPTW
jgi:adenylate cyclase